MGLLDRHKAYLEEQARQQAAEAEAARRTLQEQQARSQTDEQLRLVQEKAARSRIIKNLFPLLEVLDVRRQLEDLRKIWGTGKVDRQPGIRFIRDSSEYDFASLAYSYDYWDLHTWNEVVHLDESVGTRTRGEVRKNIRRYEIAVTNQPEPSFGVIWHEESLPLQGYATSSGERRGLFSFNPKKPVEGKDLLEGVLFELLQNYSIHPREEKRKARNRIFAPHPGMDPLHIPFGVRYQ